MALLFVESLPQSNSRMLKASIKALELLLLSAGLISTLVMVKGAVVPYSCEIVFPSLVGFWSCLSCFLSSPLYICIMINFMIVLIAASSAFHHRENEDEYGGIKVIFDDHDMQFAESLVVSPPPSRDVGEVTPPPSPPRDYTEVTEEPPATPISTTEIWPNSTEENLSEKATLSSLHEVLIAEVNEIKKIACSLNSTPDLLSDSIKEIMVTTDFPPLPRKGKEVFKEEEEAASDLSDYKENEDEDTLDATWKAITGGGQQRPKREQLKKSETWDVPPRRSTASVQRLDSEELLPSTPKWKELRKAVTFNDAVSVTRRGGLRRDPSMSITELNKQFEAFIKKFNDSIRLQRQESHKRFLEKFNQGL
ncbi:uncharacterized protein LOC105157495 [Sesamum indicum]|uniref:Uncharacterized protein LOC105157495 n=1 Tax=Sesamum indicum TaxID=4182 RepID=A0A6I9SQW0_SESIN|nr:uncharacterized protein LOC105157495 [Sesamum indicum]